MSIHTLSLIEWSATLLSLAGFWLCIRHKAVCFLFFLVADAGWFASAWAGGHTSLLAQQAIYILMNVAGYWLWRRDERMKALLDAAEERALRVDAKPAPAAPKAEEPTPAL